jgi:hypothetical protein
MTDQPDDHDPTPADPDEPDQAVDLARAAHAAARRAEAAVLLDVATPEPGNRLRGTVVAKGLPPVNPAPFVEPVFAKDLPPPRFDPPREIRDLLAGRKIQQFAENCTGLKVLAGIAPLTVKFPEDIDRDGRNVLRVRFPVRGDKETQSNQCDHALRAHQIAPVSLTFSPHKFAAAEQPDAEFLAEIRDGISKAADEMAAAFLGATPPVKPAESVDDLLGQVRATVEKFGHRPDVVSSESLVALSGSHVKSWPSMGYPFHADMDGMARLFGKRVIISEFVSKDYIADEISPIPPGRLRRFLRWLFRRPAGPIGWRRGAAVMVDSDKIIEIADAYVMSPAAWRGVQGHAQRGRQP